MDATEDIDTRDHGGRHPQDRALRRKGFAIHARPAKGPAVWVKDGTLYTEAQALEAAGVTVVREGRA
jgi:RecJ-like exonuclease